jgi:peroxin-6
MDDENAKFLKSRSIYPVFNVTGERGCGKRQIVQSLANHFGMQTYFAESCDLMTGMASTTEQKLLYTLHRATNCNPVMLVIGDFEFFGRNSDGHEDDRIVGFFRTELAKVFKCEQPIIVVAMSNCEVSSRLGEIFLETVVVRPMDKEQRFRCLLWEHQREVYDRLCWKIKRGMLENYVNYKIPEASNHNDLKVLKTMAEHTTGFLVGDLRMLYQRSINEPTEEGVNLTLNDDNFKQQLAVIKKCFSDSIGTPEIPKVKWEDIGGLASLKTEIQNSIGLPLKYAHLLGGRNMKRSGVLLFGPPGERKF